MWRYFTACNTRHYLEVLPDLLNSYNNSYHRIIKMAPKEVTSENAVQAFHSLYVTISCGPKIKMKFKKGDLVRISKLRGVFDKKIQPEFYR